MDSEIVKEELDSTHSSPNNMKREEEIGEYSQLD